eukprot:CAMPEP_0170498600 /NCGR_PEP_ID=MMETSP0208-20121228/28358_1 /TAXON_ID=197538 /ORGANISM="Strombidium inclinatum, Strain S3" /LENGTH=111 /DNA_ID=CAMNT_0010775825 /DNA_START=81 /DNA_END=416 /DNA_ORIENTATION=-
MAQEAPAASSEGEKPKENTDGSKTEVPPTKEDMHLSGYNGADEDEIMDKVIKQFSDQALDSTNNKSSQLMLSKKNARRVGEVSLEACHKLTASQVPSYIEQNFEQAWDHFD